MSDTPYSSRTNLVETETNGEIIQEQESYSSSSQEFHKSDSSMCQKIFCCLCCCMKEKQRVFPESGQTIKQGKSLHFHPGYFGLKWIKTEILLKNSDSDSPVLYIFKNDSSGDILHEIHVADVAAEIRFGRACQYYGKDRGDMLKFKEKLPQMIAIPERHHDREEPYYVFLWIQDKDEFESWRRTIAESLHHFSLEAPKLEIFSRPSQADLYSWELYWIHLEEP